MGSETSEGLCGPHFSVFHRSCPVMALLVADTCKESFSKPPPKKKWLANYIEQDMMEESGFKISSELSSEAREFVRLFDKETDYANLTANLKQLAKDKNEPGGITLSQDVIGGVVQEVLNQFQNFFENDSYKSPPVSYGSKVITNVPESLRTKENHHLLGSVIDPVDIPKQNQIMPQNISLSHLKSVNPVIATPDPKLSQHEIAPVVQGVISQFLNGSLADSDFRRSRKRSHKHANSNSHGDRSAGAGERMKRSSSVIQYRPRTEYTKPIEPPVMKPVYDENEALNLSLPKSNHNNSRVTFASEDRCYSCESSKQTFQTSKSQDLSNLEILAHTAIEVNNPYRELIQVIKKAPPQSSPMTPQCTSNNFYPDQRWPSSLQNSPVFVKKSLHTSPSISPPPLNPSPLLKPNSSVISVISSASSSQSSSVIKLKAREDLISGKEDLKRASNTTREVHNRLEKNRRAHLKQCFDELAVECDLDPKKASNLVVIKSACKNIMGLRREERENERSLAVLVQEKIQLQQRLEQLTRESSNSSSEETQDSDCDL